MSTSHNEEEVKPLDGEALRKRIAQAAQCACMGNLKERNPACPIHGAKPDDRASVKPLLLREHAEGLRHNAAAFREHGQRARERQLYASADALCLAADEIERLRSTNGAKANELRQELAASQQRVRELGAARQWRPIETAPIRPFEADRWYMAATEPVLLWNGHVQIGQYRYHRSGTRGAWHADRVISPTHWMPLPEAP